MKQLKNRATLGPVYSAARRFVDAALRADNSLFTAGRSIWEPQHVDEFYRRFVEQEDSSKDSFNNKILRQFESAPVEVVQLAAELLFFHSLGVSNQGSDSKRLMIEPLLERAGITFLPDLEEALQDGIANHGAGLSLRHDQIQLLAVFVRDLKRLKEGERLTLLSDPIAFRSFVFNLPPGRDASQRNMLIHLVFPDEFEGIASERMKQKIVKHFHEVVLDPSANVDAMLAEIRESLSGEYGSDFNFYDDELQSQWGDRAEAAQLGDGEEHDAPIVAELQSDLSRMKSYYRLFLGRKSVHAPECFAGGFVGTDFDILQDLSRQLPDELRDFNKEFIPAWLDLNPDKSKSSAAMSGGALWTVSKGAQKGDRVLCPDGAGTYRIGELLGEYYYAEGEILPHRRKVQWLDATIERAAMSEALQKSTSSIRTVSNISNYREEIEGLLGVNASLDLREADASLAKNLNIESDWLNEIIDLLREKKQIVFQGPPGTGKTFVAQALAKHLTAFGGETHLVQFHPSYAYEDFFEGFRPRASPSDAGKITFELVPGPLKRIARKADQDRANPYVLVIDEINRGNLAKVFGELYFLLEYRDQVIQLQYSSEEFHLPPNLFVIGTMNTSDRSIALVDSAMRRRFYFVDFFPTHPPIDQLLRLWLRARQLSEHPADLLDELNSRIGEDDFSVGPSYLMSERSKDRSWLARVWTHAILPLLEEHFFGTNQPVEERFGLAALERGLGQQPEELAAVEIEEVADEGTPTGERAL